MRPARPRALRDQDALDTFDCGNETLNAWLTSRARRNDQTGDSRTYISIDLDTGRIRDWPEGVEADVHYKVCDAGVYTLLDAEGRAVATRDGYVPDLLSPGDNGYGDYIIMEIGADGVIADWDAEIDPDEWKWVAI